MPPVQVEHPVRARAPAPASDFTYRSARTGAVTAGLALALTVETVVLHLWLASRHPAWAWGLTAASVATLAWLAREYRAWGRGTVRVTTEAVDIRVGGRARALVPRAALAAAGPVTWRALPDGPDAAWFNATGPAEPNVLLVFATPIAVRLAGGLLTRRVLRLGLHLDDPEAFMRAVAPDAPDAT